MDQTTSPIDTVNTNATFTNSSEPTIETVPRLSFLEAAKLRAAKMQAVNGLS